MICVRNYLQLAVAFVITSRLTMGSRSTIVCNKSFSQSVSNNHLKTHSLIHSGEKPHKCTHCNFSCNQSSNLKTHIKKHTEEKLYHCNQCQCKTADSGNLQTNKKTHYRSKPHRCTMCRYSSITRGDSKVHTMRKYTGEKPFKHCKRHDGPKA